MKSIGLANAESRTAVGNFSGVGDVLSRPRTTSPDTVGVVVQVTGGTFSSAVFEVVWSQDGTNFYSADGTADTFAALTAVGGKAKSFQVKGRFFAIKLSTFTGTNVVLTASAITG